jgi:hypothetical protein
MTGDAVISRLDRHLGEVQRLLRCDAAGLPALREELLTVAEDWCGQVTSYDTLPRRTQDRQALEGARHAAKSLARALQEDPLASALRRYGAVHGLGIMRPRRDIKAAVNMLRYATDEALKRMGPKSGKDGMKRHGVTPKRGLAMYCLELFEYFRPGEAASTKEGDTDQLLSVLYEIVSGQKDASLNKALREELPQWRAHNKAIEQALRHHRNNPA